MVAPADRVTAVAARAQEIAAEYRPPDFAHVPSADAALFLTAIDHGTGFDRPCVVEADGPYEGSALLWALGVRAEKGRVGTLRRPGAESSMSGTT